MLTSKITKLQIEDMQLLTLPSSTTLGMVIYPFFLLRTFEFWIPHSKINFFYFYIQINVQISIIWHFLWLLLIFTALCKFIVISIKIEKIWLLWKRGIVLEWYYKEMHSKANWNWNIMYLRTTKNMKDQELPLFKHIIIVNYRLNTEFAHIL